MAEVKIPSFFPLETRVETATDLTYPSKDSMSANCYAEKASNAISCIKRPGIVIEPNEHTGAPAGIYIIPWASANAGKILYAVSGTIYDVDAATTFSVGSFGRISFSQGTLATAQLAYSVAGTNKVFKFNIPGNISASTAATGVAWANSVPGMVYLQGTFYVLDATGSLYGSNIEDAGTWTALNMIKVNTAADGPVYLGGYNIYVMAFCQYSTQFFYNAGNPTGSPLSVVPNTYLEIGCASADTVVKIGDINFWLAQTRSGQLKVVCNHGLSYEALSTPAVERILQEYAKSPPLNQPDSINFWATPISVGTRVLYALCMGKTVAKRADITLILDTTNKTWNVWTRFSARTSGTGALSVDADKFVVTVTHSLSMVDQEFVTMAGNSVAEYNGIFPITVISPTQFQYTLPRAATSIPGATSAITAYTESAIPFYSGAVDTRLTGSIQKSFVQLTDGRLASILYTNLTDSLVSNGGATTPIAMRIRSSQENFDSVGSKFQEYIEVVGDKVNTTMYYRYTNDDYNTYSRYVGIPLLANRARKFNGGKFNRRAWEFVQLDATNLSIDEFSVSLHKGM
jgi:hypothetical protein